MTNAELTEVVKSLAASVVHRDNQIDAHTRQIDGLIKVTSDLAKVTAELRRSVEKQAEEMTQLVREWQAYLRTLRPQ
jgi:uncharacterized protein YoxC